MGWMKTDDDSFQICRKLKELSVLHGDDVYEFYQVQQSVPHSTDIHERLYSVAHGIIYFDEVDIEDILGCYGYVSMDQVKEEYGGDWKRILAECDFELTAGCMENLVSPPVAWQEAVMLICSMAGMEYQEDCL